MDMNPYIVYVKPDEQGYIVAVDSSEFLEDIIGWVEIDNGYGDKYHHAQNNYFPERIKTHKGAYRYKLMEGKVVKCTAEEIAEQEAKSVPVPEIKPSLEDRVGTLETDTADLAEALDMILSGVTE